MYQVEGAVDESLVAETTTNVTNEMIFVESNVCGPCAGGHCWMWGGDIDGWPYDGMPCACGAVRYDKTQDIKERIAALEKELRELEAIACR